MPDRHSLVSVSWRFAGQLWFARSSASEVNVNGHRESDTLGPAPQRERGDRSGAGQKSLSGADHTAAPSPERSADKARAAVAWIALESPV